MGRIGNPIAIARKSQTEHVTVITIVTTWELPFLDLYRDIALHPSFGFLQVRLNENGVGKGEITISGKFGQVKNNYEVTVDNKTDIKTTNVRPMKWIQGRFKVRPAAFQ